MIASSRQQLHDLVDRLSEGEVQRLTRLLRRSDMPDGARRPRPLTEADILLNEPLLPECEGADEMSTAVRGWRREGGYA